MGMPESVMQVAYAALEQAAERVVMTDRQGTILYVNPAFERMTGYARTEALGQTPRLLKSSVHDAQFYQQLWQALLAYGRVLHSLGRGDEAGAAWREALAVVEAVASTLPDDVRPAFRDSAVSGTLEELSH